MPRKNAHSDKAKPHRVSRNRVFDYAFVEDPFEKLDPDYEPSDASDGEQLNLISGIFLN